MKRILVFSLLLLGATGAALVHLPAAEDKPYQPKIDPASDAGEKAMARFRVPKEFKVSLWAAEPMLANPVCFAFDEKGRMFVAETFRLHAGVTDIRGHMNWLDDDLASRTVADRVKMMEKYEGAKIQNYAVDHDRIRLLEDTKGTGKADKSTVFADGFNHIPDGIGAGLLARDGKVWYTCIPDLWLLQDTKGTGHADVKKSLATGFGIHVGYLGHDLHGLRMGPDGKIYFSIGDRATNVTTASGHLFNPDSGAVFRCNPDGSELEIFATGLRNPQELAFDQYGNLFTADNNSDSGDRVRWTYIVEGGDSGWRIGYQFDTAVGIRGPFNAEKIWDPPFDGQPAYIVPPIANIADGPSGLTYYPGLGMPERYQGHFFLADFRGSNGSSGIRSFANKPKGAGFEMVDSHEFCWGVLATDVDFGPDCALYIADWVNGWEKPNKGRIYKVSYPEAEKDKDVQSVKKLLAEGFTQRSNKELAALLEHKDQRIRLEAQYALAAKGKDAVETLGGISAHGKNQLARIHAIWGLGQIGRAGGPAWKVLLDVAEDGDAEVRAQVLKVLGDGRVQAARPKFLEGLENAEPRVRFFAALGLSRLGTNKDDVKAITAMLRANADQDPWLRHPGVLALAACKDKAALLAAADDPSASVRLGVLLALRRQGDPEVARFLTDTDPKLVAEAARAINDVPIDSAFPLLAALSTNTKLPAMVLFRVINANFRLGKLENAKAVAALVNKPEVPDVIRVDALRALQEWARPKGRDRVMGLWRPLPPRSETLAAEALRPVMLDAFTGSDALRQEAANAAVALGLKEVGPKLYELVTDVKQPPALRVQMLRALTALKDPQLNKAMEFALADENPRLRSEGRRVLAKRKPAEALQQFEKVLESGTVIEQQGAFRTLGEMKQSDAEPLLTKSLAALLAGKVAPEAHLDLLEAAAKFKSRELKAMLDQYDKSRSKTDHLANYREALVGGDAENGHKIFLYKTEVSCLRCHKVKGVGGEVGPELTGIGSKQKRDYILESIVDPNKQIAKGFESVIITLKNGRTVTGIVKAEDAKELKLMNAEGQLIVVPKKQIDERQAGKSAMPEDIIKQLSKSELRDLVEFLSELKELSAPATPGKISHSFLATGNETYIVDDAGKVTWRYPQGTRDGWVLPNGNVLLAVTKNKEYPGGGAVEVTREGKVVFEFKGTQSEVNTVQPLDKGRVLLTEAGSKPRLLEVDRDGKIAVEIALQAQTKDLHLQTRMARKLANGNYLVPQLLDKVVREYTPAGKIVWEVKTPDMPFTAIRLADGHTLIGCTLGNLVIEVDQSGKTVWQLTNDDLPGKPLNDACGVQRLPNGDTVVTSHHAKKNEVKLTEVTRAKKIVWTLTDDKNFGIHHFQILDTNGQALDGTPMR